ncbi:MAG: nucleotidyltransferase family protein [bacterium]|nr:nucleotidyltransferase family protein [bacterium]
MTIYQTDELKIICNKQKITYLGIFGSQSRGDATSKSDIDLLVDFQDTKSYFELAHIQDELENVFGKKVDLVMKTNMKESLKPYILKDLVTVYEQR